MYKPGDYNCQMNELMFQAGPRCKRNERAKRAHSLYIYICAHLDGICKLQRSSYSYISLSVGGEHELEMVDELVRRMVTIARKVVKLW